MNKTLEYILDIVYRIVRACVHYICAVIYGMFGKKVPPVKNPILLLSATELAKRIREGKVSLNLFGTSLQKINISLVCQCNFHICVILFSDETDFANVAESSEYEFQNFKVCCKKGIFGLLENKK